MDRFLYISMTGAKETLRAQASNNHNLANVSTTGFRADLSAMQSRAVRGLRLRIARVRDAVQSGGIRSPGAMQATGQDLDIAIQGDGWIAVQGAGWERSIYTRR